MVISAYVTAEKARREKSSVTSALSAGNPENNQQGSRIDNPPPSIAPHISPSSNQQQQKQFTPMVPNYPFDNPMTMYDNPMVAMVTQAVMQQRNSFQMNQHPVYHSSIPNPNLGMPNNETNTVGSGSTQNIHQQQ